jgi:hypothetical protein
MKLLKRIAGFLHRRRKAVTLSVVLLAIGASFRWEVREVNDARTGKPISRYQGIVFPWEPCGASGGGTLVDFHVRHWLCFGLVKVEARGQTM